MVCFIQFSIASGQAEIGQLHPTSTRAASLWCATWRHGVLISVKKSHLSKCDSTRVASFCFLFSTRMGSRWIQYIWPWGSSTAARWRHCNGNCAGSCFAFAHRCVMLCAPYLLAWEHPFVEACSLVHHRLFTSLFSASSFVISVFCLRFFPLLFSHSPWPFLFLRFLLCLVLSCPLGLDSRASSSARATGTEEEAAREQKMKMRKKLHVFNEIFFYLWFVSLQKSIEHWVCGSIPGRNTTSVENCQRWSRFSFKRRNPPPAATTGKGPACKTSGATSHDFCWNTRREESSERGSLPHLFQHLVCRLVY